MARAGKSKDTPGGAKRWLIRGIKFGLVATVGALFAIVVAVVIAYQSLPDYESLNHRPMDR